MHSGHRVRKRSPSAFAFGPPGHLLTSAAAVEGERSVEFVTADNRAAHTEVVHTTNPRLVQLRSSLVLSPLRGASQRVLSRRAIVATGPLAPSGGEDCWQPAERRGSDVLGVAFEGAPVLTVSGRVIGVAVRHQGRLAIVSVTGLRPLPGNARKSRDETGRNPRGCSHSLCRCIRRGSRSRRDPPPTRLHTLAGANEALRGPEAMSVLTMNPSRLSSGEDPSTNRRLTLRWDRAWNARM